MLKTDQPDAYPTELLIELHYLPCLDYVSGLMRFGRVKLEAQEHYQKQSYRNRCYVRASHRVESLTVPVLRSAQHVPIRDLRIDNGQPWAVRHGRALRAAYGKAPFYEYYAPDFEPVYARNWTFLFDLNYELLTICLNRLGVRVALSLTDWYDKQPPTGLFDARSRINRSRDDESYVFHNPVTYDQNFGQNFVPNLSCIDLLFCQGPAAADVIRAGLRSEQIRESRR